MLRVLMRVASRETGTGPTLSVVQVLFNVTVIVAHSKKRQAMPRRMSIQRATSGFMSHYRRHADKSDAKQSFTKFFYGTR